MENLKKLRKMEGLSQQELANKLDLTAQDIEEYETNIKYPSIETLKAMANIFYVNIETLLDREMFWLFFPSSAHRKLTCIISRCSPDDVNKLSERVDNFIK